MAYLNEYEYLKTLGNGSFATVFKGRHIKLDYVRAIRELHGGVDSEDTPLYQNFLAECKILLRLGNGGHPNIIHIYQPRLLEKRALVEMDYIEGCDIESYLIEQNNFIPIDEVMRFVREIGSALAYCHEDIYEFCIDRGIDYTYELDSELKGGTFIAEINPNDARDYLLTDLQRKELINKYKVIHNDLHSRNIMRKKYDGSYILLDFGLAIENGTVIKSSKRKGGAPEYKAPEKWDDDRIISEQVDIYGFGVLMYEMLAGRVPFPYDKGLSQQPAEYKLSEEHKKKIPPAIGPLRRAAFEAANPGRTYTKDYPDWLEQMIMKCLEKKPENRYYNATVLSRELKIKLLENGVVDSEIIHYLKTLNENLRIDMNSLVHENTNIKNRLTRTTERESRIKKEKAEIKSQLVALEQSSETMQQTINDLKEENERLRKESDKKVNPVLIALGLFVVALLLFFSASQSKGFLKEGINQLIEFIKPPPDSKKDSSSKPLILKDVKLQFIPGGKFSMGSPESERERKGDEIQHTVTVSAFYLSEKVITNEQYCRFLKEKGVSDNGQSAVSGYGIQTLVESHEWGVQYVNGEWHPAPGKADYPVVKVSWYGAKDYCDWAGGRLPTEAEWEYACRAGITTTPFNTGLKITTKQANYKGNDLNDPYDSNGAYIAHTVAAGSYVPNKWGLYNMHGNVWEWCNDWYGIYSSASLNPPGPASGLFRVQRGGGWRSSARRCRSAVRDPQNPSYITDDVGFRIARSK